MWATQAMNSCSDITIKSIRVRAVVVPMPEPHRTAGGTVSESPLVLTDITTSSGVVGRSMIFTYTAMALKPTAEFVRNLEPLLVGEKLAPRDICLKLQRSFRLLGTQGLVGMALAAIDMALWDALARSNEISLTTQLGCKIKPVKAYGAIGYDGEKGCAQAAELWASKGFKGIKAKIGYPTIDEDVAVIRAMRKAASDDMAIMVDYNQCLTPTEAIERIRVLDAEGLTWVEEPTMAHDYTGHAHISRATRTPVQCGENWWSILDLQHAITAKASDYLMPDVMKIGGVSGWLKAAALAEVHGLKISSHLWPEVSARLLCCTPTAHWLEYSDWWNPVLANPLTIENGEARVDDEIGSGVEWQEAVIENLLV